MNMPNSRKSVKPKTAGNNKRSDNHPNKCYESSGNIFKDMGKSESEAGNLQMRSQLMIAIEDIITERGWTQVQAAKVIGVARPRIAELFASRIDLFGLDTLVKYLHKLGKRVNLRVEEREIA